MRRNLLICLALIALTAMVYWPAREHEFVLFDDPQFVTDNAEVNAGLTWHGVKWAFTQPLLANWHPVTTLSHQVDCQLFGVNAGAHHLVSVALHAVNGALLFLLLAQMTGATWRSAAAAALFALHPLRVESVVWIAERKDLLSGMFMMLTLWAYARHVERGAGSREQGAGSGAKKEFDTSPYPLPDRGGEGKHGAALVTSSVTRHSPRHYWLALVFFALALMSKPMVVTLPCLLLLLDVWPLRRIWKMEDGGWKMAGGEQRSETKDQRSETRLSTFNFQLSTFVPLVREKLPFFGLTAVFCVITVYLQRSAGAVAHVGGLSFADRAANAVVSYALYLQKLFWPTKLAVIYPHPAAHGMSFFEQWPVWQVVGIALGLVGISVWCLRELRRRPYLAVGWFWYLGSMVPVIGLVQVGEQAMADRYTYIPLIGPVISLVWWVADAVSQPKLRRVLLPALAGIVVITCAVLTRRQLAVWQNTITLFDHAVRVTTKNASAEFGLGTGYDAAGDHAQAMSHYRAALEIDPAEARARRNLALLLKQQNLWPEAAAQFRTILDTQPDDLPALLNLADALTHFGRDAEAAMHLEHALALAPDSLEALNNFAWLLATSPDDSVRNGARAVELAERACAISGFKRVVFIGTLAAAQAEAGRFAEAIATAERAVALAEQNHEMELAKSNQRLLELYRAGRAYREKAEN
ncbi:MAG: tetratricopeptide repeat protein [Verrucomicrobia bacterium]|nr:MAG: tetratricopeptide repeat protein [Verrucomicrobiota bacterium]